MRSLGNRRSGVDQKEEEEKNHEAVGWTQTKDSYYKEKIELLTFLLTSSESFFVDISNNLKIILFIAYT
jgi:hypothetical protein